MLDTGYEGTETLRNHGKCVPNDECHIPEDLNRHKKSNNDHNWPILRLMYYIVAPSSARPEVPFMLIIGYSLLRGLRALARTISYEVRLAR